MGKSSISYKKNAISFDTAKKFYSKPSEEASSIELMNKFTRPSFDKVIDIEEFDSNEYTFIFENGWFMVKGKSIYWN